jgi:hypothetical protein
MEGLVQLQAIETENTTTHKQNLASINRTFGKRDLQSTVEIEEAKQQITAQTATATFGAVSQMFNMLGDAAAGDFERQKKFKIAAAWTSGFQGAVSAFAGAMQLGPIAGPIVGGILAAVTLGMTAMNVGKIKATNPGGGGSGGGSSPSVSAGAIPRLSAPTGQQVTPATTGEQNISDSIAEANSSPSKSYVVSGDVTSQAELDRKIETKATI